MFPKKNLSSEESNFKTIIKCFKEVGKDKWPDLSYSWSFSTIDFSVRINHQSDRLLNGDISVIYILIVTASVSKLLYSWLFTDPSEHHYTTQTWKFNHFIMLNNGGVHKRTNHVPEDVSDRNPKRDLNYVRSHALQTPSQSRSWSAHCEVIFCSYCAVRARRLIHVLMHGFSAHF